MLNLQWLQKYKAVHIIVRNSVYKWLITNAVEQHEATLITFPYILKKPLLVSGNVCIIYIYIYVFTNQSPFNLTMFTWYIVDVTSIQEKVTINWVTERREDASERHTGTHIPPQTACKWSTLLATHQKLMLLPLLYHTVQLKRYTKHILHSKLVVRVQTTIVLLNQYFYKVIIAMENVC